MRASALTTAFCITTTPSPRRAAGLTHADQREKAVPGRIALVLAASKLRIPHGEHQRIERQLIGAGDHGRVTG
jgi:hypothetical protein